MKKDCRRPTADRGLGQTSGPERAPRTTDSFWERAKGGAHDELPGQTASPALSAGARRFPKEPFCGWSHLLGLALSIAGSLVLLYLAHGNLTRLVGFGIYGASLVSLYTASSLYHSWHCEDHAVDRLRKLDLVGIFLLIAGTYAPVCIVALRGKWGWSLLGIEYGLAAIGIAAILFWRQAPNWIRVVLYVVMGWMAVVALAPLRQALTPAGLAWLFAGGIVYSIGTIIYAIDRPHIWPGKFSAHDLWHIFVLGGSVCHYVVVLRFIAL